MENIMAEMDKDETLQNAQAPLMEIKTNQFILPKKK